jgi:hypothetical protein
MAAPDVISLAILLTGRIITAARNARYNKDSCATLAAQADAIHALLRGLRERIPGALPSEAMPALSRLQSALERSVAVAEACVDLSWLGKRLQAGDLRAQFLNANNVRR